MSIFHFIFHLSCSISSILPSSSSIFYLLSSIFYLLSSIFYLLSSIFYLLSSIFYLLSSIFYLLSSIFCLFLHAHCDHRAFFLPPVLLLSCSTWLVGVHDAYLHRYHSAWLTGSSSNSSSKLPTVLQTQLHPVCQRPAEVCDRRMVHDSWFMVYTRRMRYSQYVADPAGSEASSRHPCCFI
ncbi:hypothetical protein EJ05DRAFT_231884 [Pseudovirgaria hyperparasitica]|uniref:Uncharacterized protein n=1 Tax=Pseudovirgaria hyperparasitica TaxID=470096 RepID=A0A6A6VS23_9PEZI|nr:uncharacterized protein EJ05DRAFT_231884 [Pseudovirgaria hyperparasitica]KAF2752955.1 hypothetical protein EJ05DRAFT_231884 [Pseudovirgaria hyperparasitica]